MRQLYGQQLVKTFLVSHLPLDLVKYKLVPEPPPPLNLEKQNESD